MLLVSTVALPIFAVVTVPAAAAAGLLPEEGAEVVPVEPHAAKAAASVRCRSFVFMCETFSLTN